MIFDISSYSSIGKRKSNQDSYYCKEAPNGIFAIVADGVGGYGGGELASALAVNTIRDVLLKLPATAKSVSVALRQANQRVLALSKEDFSPKTTAVLLYSREGKTIAANSGDSRIYQFRDGKIIFQSEDHSAPQEDVNAGLITKDQIRSHPYRNQITSCLGIKNSQAFLYQLDVQIGDRFLLCSDGFWDPVEEKVMCNCIPGNDTAEAWLDAMKVIATEKQKDNHTAIAVVAKSV